MGNAIVLTEIKEFFSNLQHENAYKKEKRLPSSLLSF
jgi:hypothetical protein